VPPGFGLWDIFMQRTRVPTEDAGCRALAARARPKCEIAGVEPRESSTDFAGANKRECDPFGTTIAWVKLYPPKA
jgi:hypothetical protein